MAEYSVFLRLGGGQIQPPPGALPFADEIAERLRRFHHDFPEWEMWQISEVVGNNVYHVALGHQAMEHVRAITNDPADFGVEDWVIVGFYKGDRSRPFILALGTIPIETVVAEVFWNAVGSDFSQDNYSEVELELGETLASVSVNFPFMIRDYARIVRFEAALLRIQDGEEYISVEHGITPDDLKEMVLLDKIYLFTAETWKAFSYAGALKYSVGYGVSSVSPFPAHSYEDYGHPGRVCDPDGGGVVIGGL